MREARALVVASVVLVAAVARADGDLPPWAEADDVPLPSWTRSVQPKKPEVALFGGPSAVAARRGSAAGSSRLPLFGARRGAGCAGRWMLVGPYAWVCSDAVDLRAEEPHVVPALVPETGLPFRYFFVGRGGARAWLTLERAEDDEEDQTLDPGFAVAVTEERVFRGESWAKTRHGGWIAVRDLVPTRPSTFHGVELDGDAALDWAWVIADRATVVASPKSRKPTGARARYDRVKVLERDGAMVRIDEGAWIAAKDLARPELSSPPDEAKGERWIDVDLASQTLVAYDGARPVYATLVSTGIGAPGTDTGTPPGLHRIWVKLLASTMDNLRREDAERFYSIEDVPYVQFFDRAIALHGAFWHDGFGRPRSHGCVNLAPRDAAWLFAFTAPHLPEGWVASLPVAAEPGAWVRIR